MGDFMYKIIIADDEIHILRLVKRFIKSEFLTVIAEAQNGIDAYQLTIDLKPDILITDIRMPGYDGIEMIKKLKTQMPDLNIIIISGYRDFEYAQEALRYGVMEYLLKPIRESDLNSAINKAVEKIKEEQMIEADVNTIKETLSETSKVLESRSVLNFFFGKNEPFSNISHDKYFPQLLSDENGEYFVGILKTDNINSTQPLETNILEILTYIADDIVEIFSKNGGQCISFSNDINRIYIVCKNSQLKQNIFFDKKILSDLHALLRTESYKYGFLRFTFGIGSVVQGTSGLKKSLKQAEKFLLFRVNNPNEYIFSHNNYSLSEKKGNPLIAKLQQDIKKSIETRDKLKISAAFDMLSAELKSNNIEAYELYQAVPQIINETKNIILQSEPLSNYEESAANTLYALDNTFDIETVLDITKNFITTGITLLITTQEQRVSRPVRLAQEYIKQHFDKQVTLEEVAQQVYMNPNYLSSLFKQKANIGFSEYVTKVKVEKAKELLQSSFLNINEIANAVGYTDVKRFSKMFIKYVGIRPSEYRKFYS